MKRNLSGFSHIELGTFILLEIILTGFGMGVPILNILFGFYIGFYITRKLISKHLRTKKLMERILTISILTSLFTFLLMLIIWGPQTHLLFEEKTQFENFGHPFILYDPKISFVGWLILMIFISPFLQLLSSIFSSFLAIYLLTDSN